MIFKFIFSVVRLSRPINMILTAITVYFIALLSDLSLQNLTILFTALSAIFTGAAGNIINDIFDLEIDKINRKDRVLPSGKISVKTAWIVYFFCNLTALVLAYIYLNSAAFIIVIFTQVILFFYSYQFKYLPLLGNIVVAGILGLTFIYASISFDHILIGMIPASLAFLFSLTRELAKVIQDVEGDKMLGAKTLPIIWSVSKTKNLTTFIFILSLAALYIPFIFYGYKNTYFFLISLFVFLPGIVIIYKLKNAVSSQDFGEIASWLKWLIIPSLLSILLDKWISF